MIAVRIRLSGSPGNLPECSCIPVHRKRSIISSLYCLKLYRKMQVVPLSFCRDIRSAFYMKGTRLICCLKEVRCNIHGSQYKYYPKLISYCNIGFFPASPLCLCNGKGTALCHGNHFMWLCLCSLNSDISRAVSGL